MKQEALGFLTTWSGVDMASYFFVRCARACVRPVLDCCKLARMLVSLYTITLKCFGKCKACVQTELLQVQDEQSEAH